MNWKLDTIGQDRVIRLLAVAAALVFCVHVFSDNKADVDLWGNAGFVKAPAWDPAFRHTNSFSFTEPAHAWVNHEWLAEYILHVTHERFGNPGLLAFKIFMGFCLVLVLYTAIKSECSSPPIRFLFLLLVVSTMGYGFSTRPHHFTYFFYALFLLLLKKWPQSRVFCLFLVPIIGVLWANLHGAFFIGALLLAVYMILEITKSSHVNDTVPRHIPELAAVLGMFVLASLINPYGIRLWSFIFESFTMFRPYLSEWAPFNRLEQVLIHPDFIALAVLSFVGICFSRKPQDITWAGILAVAFVGAIVLRRNIPLFAITASFVVPRYLDDIAAKPVNALLTSLSRRVIIVFLCAFILVTSVAAFFFNKVNPFEMEVRQDRFPGGVVHFMKENRLSGNALVFFDWAEYSIWQLYPDCTQFLDGRFSDAYSKATIEDYFNFLYCGKNWDNALKNYPTDIVLIHRGNPVYRKMTSRDDWVLVCQNNIAALFLKKDVHADFIAKLVSGQLRAPRTPPIAFFPE